MSTHQSFAELGVSRAVVGALATAGIREPFAIQRSVIGDALAGRDVIAQSPTGSGKTLAFGVPLVERIAAEGPRPAALVVAPTRELALQIVDEIRGIAHARALRLTAVYGGSSVGRQARDAAQSHILVATPGRLEDLLARGAFTLEHIQVLVLDEADRMLDMGFRPAIDRILSACPSSRQTLLFSATLDGEAGRLAGRYTSEPATHRQGTSAPAANREIEHRFVQIAHQHRVDALVSELGRDRGLALVFVRTKHGADRLVKQLRTRGLDAVAMHGNKSQRQRERALAQFESGAIDTLVATDVAARGIDVEHISHVINFDPPADSETYVHRVGRTGRAGRSGTGITLLSPEQHGDVAKLAGRLGLSHGLHDRGAGRSASAHNPRPTGAGRSASAHNPRPTGAGRSASAHNPRPTGAGRSASAHASDARTPTGSSGRPPRRRRRRSRRAPARA